MERLDVGDGILGLLVDLLYGRLALVLGYLRELFGELVRAELSPLMTLSRLVRSAWSAVDLFVPVLFELTGSPPLPAAAEHRSMSLARSSRSTQVTMDEAK